MVSLLHTLLQLDGFEVLGGLPDKPFLEAARASRPDLILMDVFLRGTDGLDLLTPAEGRPGDVRDAGGDVFRHGRRRTMYDPGSRRRSCSSPTPRIIF